MQQSASEIVEGEIDRTPLVIDLDGTLIGSDLLVESAFTYVSQNPIHIVSLLTSLRRGKASLKAQIAAEINIDPAHLAYDGRVIDLAQQARAAGRPVYLASASNERYVSAVATHLGLFDGWFASDSTHNLSGRVKADRLISSFGERGFDYVGNDAVDLAVWTKARKRIAVRPSGAVERELLEIDPSATILRHNDTSIRTWAKLLRVHQWAKNALVFVPLITAQHFDISSLAYATLAFFAFSLTASGVYLINDLVDLEADRRHLTKRNRPLAAGLISPLNALMAAACLVAVATLGTIALAPWLGLALVGYLLLTTAYTFALKRKMIIDVVTLGMLYTLRVIGGAAAISVPVSEWLLAFSMFMFICLALIKRYSELAGRLDANLPDATNRNYRKTDLQIVGALAAASGFNSVTVFTLYISSDTVRQLYSHPQVLWLICPTLLYWIGRVLLLAHRRLVDDDPILFAVKDRVSLFSVLAIGLILIAAR